jgi:hypothetical protein
MCSSSAYSVHYRTWSSMECRQEDIVSMYSTSTVVSLNILCHLPTLYCRTVLTECKCGTIPTALGEGLSIYGDFELSSVLYCTVQYWRSLAALVPVQHRKRLNSFRGTPAGDMFWLSNPGGTHTRVLCNSDAFVKQVYLIIKACCVALLSCISPSISTSTK